MKKKLSVLLLILTLVGCTSIEKRKIYDRGNHYEAKEIPYIPTFSAPTPEVLGLKNNLFIVSIIGIPYVVGDYICSTIMDIFLLPSDIYRNKVIVPKRQQLLDLGNEKAYLLYEFETKLKTLKTDKEKQKLILEYKEAFKEYNQKIEEIEKELK
ncbi:MULTISPECIES: hypothetical protein [Fusobacterium]|uniref:hypothetical protein n=1 Tax=Fusobacterium TaxID=848 RepID=UPI001476E7B6|nr:MULTISPECIES: hypothetical protein [Fusobacterium]NME36472.1 hypothetical protein [Fusobacterium sp. FSA-380-WT-3A]